MSEATAEERALKDEKDCVIHSLAMDEATGDVLAFTYFTPDEEGHTLVSEIVVEEIVGDAIALYREWYEHFATLECRPLDQNG